MTNEQAIEAAIAWAQEQIPALAGAYDHEPSAKTAALPDVVAVLENESVRRSDPDFPIMQLQQVAIRRFDLGLSFMVEAGETPEDAGASQQLLRSFAEALTTSLLNDETLGGRVAAAAATTIEFDYTPPFVEYEDGTRGRHMMMRFAIGDPLVLE